jgi:hypothetical protein
MAGDADRIYRAITKLERSEKPLLLVLLSGGGESDAAYLIGKLCREFSNGKFVVVIPRYAKSAATLLSCAADEIHMGNLSELGPIDPQINKMPALGLKNAIEHIAGLMKMYPEAAEMFAKYMHLSIAPIQIGYYERVAESSLQYAERLLKGRTNAVVGDPRVIAWKLVYGYKDHGFVIDKAEAAEVFGAHTVKSNTPEYILGNMVYTQLSKCEDFADLLKHNFYFIGSLDSGPTLTKRIKK